MIARRRFHRSGATAVEAAVVLPVLFLLVIGTIVGGTAVFRYQQAACLAREAARYASVRGGIYQGDTWNDSPTRQQIIDAAVTPKAAGLTAADLTVSVEWIDNGTGTATEWDAAPKDVRSVTLAGEYVMNTVRVTVTCRVTQSFFGDPLTVTGVCELPMSN